MLAGSVTPVLAYKVLPGLRTIANKEHLKSNKTRHSQAKSLIYVIRIVSEVLMGATSNV